LRVFVNNKQSNWAKLLFMAEFIYIASYYINLGTILFFAIYEYYFEIRLELENRFLNERVFAANERIKQLQKLQDYFGERLRSAVDAQIKQYNKYY